MGALLKQHHEQMSQASSNARCSLVHASPDGLKVSGAAYAAVSATAWREVRHVKPGQSWAVMQQGCSVYVARVPSSNCSDLTCSPLQVQGWAAHEHTTQQLQDLAHSNKVNILVTLVVAAVFVPQMPALLAIPLGCCLLGFSWHLLGPWLSLPWPMGHKKPPPSHMSVPFRPTDDFTMPVQFVSPFAAYASAPANISVQGSLDRDGSCGGSPQPPSRCVSTLSRSVFTAACQITAVTSSAG